VESRALRRLTIVSAAAVVIAAAAVVTNLVSGRGADDRLPPPDVTDQARQRIRVQVLNATATRGLARRATMFLRDQGFDVVETGTAPSQLDSTLVLDRSGHPDRAQRVADALGGAPVEARPDSSRYLDVTVLLGRSWRPPAHPLYP